MKAVLFVLLLCVPATFCFADDQIELRSRTFTPAEGIDENLSIGTLPPTAHVLIQFRHIPSTAERDELALLGVQLQDYIPNNAFFAAVDRYYLADVADLSFVRSIVKISAEDKIAQNILERNASTSYVSVNTIFFSDASYGEIFSTISYYGYYLVEPESNKVWVIYLPEDSITTFAMEDIVQWIGDSVPENGEDNNGARAAVGVNTLQASPYDLHGNGITIAEWDSGHADQTHDDLATRVIYGDSATVKDHSTHVAGTAIGNGSLSGGSMRGMADQARLISYEWPSGDDGLNEMDSETGDALTNYDSILSTNSWSWSITSSKCYLMGYYDEWSQNYDDIVGGKLGEPIVVVFSAGNKRDDGICGVASRGGFDCIGGPGGTSKNTITVGAVNSNGGMTAFSSWGPTDDGRIKPDIVAPGCQSGGDYGINSTKPGDSYGVMCGTSMATPVVSGVIALLREEFDTSLNKKHFLEVLPSTYKALLLHTATDLGNTGPDYSYGFGQINTTYAVDMIRDGGPNNVLVEENLSTGESDNYTLYVSPGTKELKVTLVWDDEPGSVNANRELVNDLDLTIKAPDGIIHYPWTLDKDNPANAASRGTDRINNVEQVVVSNPAAGNWTINVSGYSIPIPVQKYSLVYENFLPDVWISDSSEDDGSTPSPRPFWTSPDIWVDSDRDGSADFDAVSGQENHLYARIKNIGAEASGSVNVSFYWSDPSGGIPYPAGWHYIGSQIISNISAGANVSTHVSWYPEATPDHQCILVRVENAKDPIRKDGDIVWENNIGMKNFWVVQVSPGTSMVFSFKVGNPVDDASVEAYLEMDMSGVPSTWSIEMSQSPYQYLMPGETTDNSLTVSPPTAYGVNDSATVHITQYVYYTDPVEGYVEEVYGGLSIEFRLATTTTTSTSSTTSTVVASTSSTATSSTTSTIASTTSSTSVPASTSSSSTSTSSSTIQTSTSSTTPTTVIGTTSTTSSTTSSIITTTSTTSTTSTTVPPHSVTVTRDLPDSAAPESTYTVRLTMDVNESIAPEAVGVVEYYPSGWNVSSISLGGQDWGDRIEWLFWSLGNTVQDREITYEVTVPASADGQYYFNGTVDIGSIDPYDIAGDTGITVSDACTLSGDYYPCNAVTLSEVVNYINLWAEGSASLSEVITLINAWAYG